MPHAHIRASLLACSENHSPMASRTKRVTKTYSRRNRNYDSGNRNRNRTVSQEIDTTTLFPPQPPATQANDGLPSPYVLQGTQAQTGLENTLRVMCDGVAWVERVHVPPPSCFFASLIPVLSQNLRSVKREASKIQVRVGRL